MCVCTIWTPPTHPSPTVNTHFLYVSNGCYFPLGGVSKIACCQTMPYSFPAVVDKQFSQGGTGFYCFTFIFNQNKNTGFLHQRRSLMNLLIACRKKVVMLEGKPPHTLSVHSANASLQGWIGSGWVCTWSLVLLLCVHSKTKCHRRKRQEK